MTAVVTKRKILPPEKLVAIEFKQYLKAGGNKQPLVARVAAFDRIADKHLKMAAKREA